MKKKKIKIVSLILALMIVLISLSPLLYACSVTIKIEAQPSLITEPLSYSKAKNSFEILNDGDAKKAPVPIDFEKDDKKKIIASAWANMYYAPFMLSRQTGDVTTFSAGTKVVQNVSTYRMAMRGDKQGLTDDKQNGLVQKINYMQSNSVTSQGIPGIDIRLMVEVLRNSSGVYEYRQATDRNNIKLDPKTSEFYNMSGRWESKKSNNISLFNQGSSKDDPNKIISYKVDEESIKQVKEISIDQYIQTLQKDEDKQAYETSKKQIEAKQMLGYKIYKVSFNPIAWEHKYIGIMYDMLNLGGQSGKIYYNSLNMYIEVWENGYIRQLTFEEQYDIDLGSLKANATLASNIQISYKEKQKLLINGKEEEFNWPRRYLNRFMKKFKNDRKPDATVDKTKLK